MPSTLIPSSKSRIYHFVHFFFLFVEGDIVLKKNGTTCSLANMMSMTIPLHKFNYLFDLIGVCSLR